MTNNPQSPTSDVPDAVKYIAIELYDNEIRYDGVTIYRGPYKREDVERIVEREKYKAVPVPDGEIIEVMAKERWQHDYPNGGSMYKTYEDTPLHDKELYRREAQIHHAALRSSFMVTIGRKG